MSSELAGRVGRLWDETLYRKDGFDLDIGLQGGRCYIEVQCKRPDTYTGEFGTGYGGKRYLRDEMTDSEIVRNIFGAFMAYEEHECREAFQFRGVRIFGPHIDVEYLVEAGKHIEDRAALS
jgi:hypothetical protein